MNASRRSTMRPSCLLVVPDAHPMAPPLRGRGGDIGPAVVSAFALHAACLGALIEFQYSQTPPAPQQETVIELAMLAPPEPVPVMPADPPASAPPAPQLSADEPAVSPPPEPSEIAAAPPETAPPVPLAQLPVADDPTPATTTPATQLDPPPPESSPPAPETRVPEMGAVVAPTSPVVEITQLQPWPKPLAPQPQFVHTSPRPAPHSVAIGRGVTATREDSAANGASAKTETNTPPVAPFPSLPALANQEAALEARVRDAVQAAVHYPAAARMMGVTGRARVLLDYRNGSVASPILAQSSGVSMLDEAALAAARAARYPPPPPAIVGRLLRLLVWVEFRSG